MNRPEDWTDHLFKVVPLDDPHGAHRSFIAELFRLAQHEARARAMQDVKATLTVTLEDLCVSK